LPDEQPPGPGGNPVKLIWFSPDESVLATGEFAGTVRLWNVRTGKVLAVIKSADGDRGPAGGFLNCIDLTADGATLLTVRVYDANDLDARPLGGKILVAPFEPRSVLCLWDRASGTALRRWETPGVVSAVAFTPDGRAVATTTEDRVTLWEAATGKERFHCQGGSAVVRFSPDGRVLAAGGVGAVLRLIDLATGQEFGQLKGHQAEVQALAFLPGGKGLVSGSIDSTALVWDGARLTPPAPKRELSVPRLAALWDDLAAEDAGQAFRAAAALRASPKGAVALLGEHLKPVAEPDVKQVRRWLADLDGDDFAVREKASAELGRLGELVRPVLDAALRNGPSPEATRQVRALLDRLKVGAALSPEDLRSHRAVEVLGGVGTPEAKRLLQELAKGAPAARLTRDADAALQRRSR
jgi:hypothetical protein